MALLSLPKYATEVFHNPPRSLEAGLGWAGGGLASARAVIGHTHVDTGS